MSKTKENLYKEMYRRWEERDQVVQELRRAKREMNNTMSLKQIDGDKIAKSLIWES